MAAGVPSTNQIIPFSQEALQSKSKLGARMELPGLFYTQYTPTAANVTTGDSSSTFGLSLIGANQLGTLTAGTVSTGGTATVTSITSNSGALVTFGSTTNFLPTTLNYDQFPVKFALGSGGVLPSNIIAGQVYYWQWVSQTTGRLAATPGGTVLDYVSNISGTVYIQAATQYWGSPVLPAGFLQVSDTLNQSSPSSPPAPGCMIRVEIEGHARAASTDVLTVTPGLISTAGTFSSLMSTNGPALAGVNAGPFPFKITSDIIIQQYGLAAVSSPYNAAGLVRCLTTLQVFSTVSTNTVSTGLTTATWAKTTIDLTQSYAVDVRAFYATPAVAQYLEPLFVRMWAYN